MIGNEYWVLTVAFSFFSLSVLFDSSIHSYYTFLHHTYEALYSNDDMIFL